jgi:hypothetical protein
VAAIPEVSLNWGLLLGEHWSVAVGYNFLYWGNAARGGDQINRTVNVQPVQAPGQPPPPQVGVAQPAFVFHDSGFWAQGLTVGVAFHY